MKRRHAARRDDGEREVIESLREIGVVVYQHLPVDLLCGYMGRLVIAEFKDGRKPPSARKLTALEQKAIADFKQAGVNVPVWTNFDQALDHMGVRFRIIDGGEA